MSIVKDMAVTASIAITAMVSHSSSDFNRYDRDRQEFELFRLYGEPKESSKTTEIVKYFLMNSQEVETISAKDIRHLRFVQQFAAQQIDLEDDFLAVMDKMERETRVSQPKRVRFSS